MEFKAFLFLLVGGVISSTIVIVLIFIIINICIKKKGSNSMFFEMKNHLPYNNQGNVRPPLPPRNLPDTQSTTNSYEEVPEIPLRAEETSSLQSHGRSHPIETHVDLQDTISVSESYDDVDELQNDINKFKTAPDNPVVPKNDFPKQNSYVTRPIETKIDFQDDIISASESYDDVDELQNVRNSYEEVASLPDYLEVDPSSLQNESDESESYDDVDQLGSDNEEDYDDIG